MSTFRALVVICSLWLSAAGISASEWVKLTAGDAAANDQFGGSVAVSGSTALIGAYRDDTLNLATGSAFVFQRNGTGDWAFVKKFAANDSGGGDEFGRAVFLREGIALIGAPSEDDRGSESGAAYIFERDLGGANAWGQRKKLIGSDVGPSAAAGTAIALGNGPALVGAPRALNGVLDSGAVYLFDQNAGGANAWGEIKRLVGPGAGSGSRFGAAVAIDGDTIVVGSPGDGDTAANAGAVYIFKRDQGGASNWGFVLKVTLQMPEAGDEFGAAVALQGNRLVVGAPQSSAGGSGVAYVFDRNLGGAESWGLLRTLTPANPATQFGAALTMDAGLLVVGAPAEGKSGLNAGGAYVFYRDLGGIDQYGQASRLFGSDTSAEFRFGASVALAGRTVLAGAPGDDHAGMDSGSAYVFDPAAGAPTMRLRIVPATEARVEWIPPWEGYALDRASTLTSSWEVVSEAAISPATFPVVAGGYFYRLRPHERVEIEFVPVGDTENVADATGFGQVMSAFQIAAFEVSNSEYARFLNAVARGSDPNGLYNLAMASDPRGGISRTGAPGAFQYASKPNMGNKPVVYVSYYDALRFANWLHNGQPFGAPEATEEGAYTFSGPTSAGERLPNARVWLPSEDEWYKAAYYDPELEGGAYWLYPTRSDLTPDLALANSTGDISNPGANIANFSNGAEWNAQAGNVTTVGSAGLASRSYYEAADLGGNAAEWTGTALGGSRVVRGGSWGDFEASLEATTRGAELPTVENNRLGFRVARP